MKSFITKLVSVFIITILVFANTAQAYWIWTPQTKKFINPKYAVKDSPKEQYDWAMSFYDAKDFQRAATEFEKLAKQYEFSEYASKSQYYVGLCYENMQKYYIAFQNYQKAIDNFPHIANTDEILARQFAIGNIYLDKPSPKVLGADIMAPLDRAVEIFKKVVENAPYGKYSQEAQFKLGEALKKSERYEEAVQSFHKLIDDYPASKYATQAMYEEAYCAYKASLKPAYDVEATDNAIKTFEKFVVKNKDSDLAKDADLTMKRLKDNVAEKSFKAAQFYESQGKKEAAIIYYQDVITTYPDSSFAAKAKDRIDALKNARNSKPSAPINFDKKKPESVTPEVQKKSPWKPLSFRSKKPVSREKVDTAVQDISNKKEWKPLDFSSKKPVKEEKIEPAAEEAPKKSSWQPLSFDNRDQTSKKKADTASQDIPKKKPWKPFNFDAKKEEAPKKNPWKPFSFNSKKIDDKNKADSEDVVKETAQKKEWKPLNFETSGSGKSGEWKPLKL